MYFTPSAIIRRSASRPSVRFIDTAIERHLDQGFERFLNGAMAGAGAVATPQTTFAQDDQGYTVTLDVPGVPRDQFSIGIEDNIVRIETLAEAPRSYRAAYELPTEIDASASQASLEHGVLTLRLLKKAPVSRVTPLTVN